MTRQQILATNGRFFCVHFTKRNGEYRKMIARIGVRKYLKGGNLAYDPRKKKLVIVWDAQKKDYRSVRCWSALSMEILKIGAIPASGLLGCPRQDNAKLISLWDIMKAFNQTRFQVTSWLLGFVQGSYSSMFHGDELANAEAQKDYVGQFKKINQEIHGLDLPVTFAQISENLSTLKTDRVTCREFSEMAAGISDTLRREMQSKKLFLLSAETQNYFGAKNAFGEAVAEAFGGAEYDIAEAGNCLALGRATACAFHSMRVLEHGLCALMADLGLPMESPSWHEMIQRIESEITLRRKQRRRSGNWREDEQFHSEAAAQFMHFKNAWRNYTAHKDFKYTEDEAEAIYRHVRDFMIHLSTKLKEAKMP